MFTISLSIPRLEQHLPAKTMARLPACSIPVLLFVEMGFRARCLRSHTHLGIADFE